MIDLIRVVVILSCLLGMVSILVCVVLDLLGVIEFYVSKGHKP